MRYCLISWRNANSFREIKGFSKVIGYNYNENDLIEIDKFCQRFTNSQDLKEFLYDAGLISQKELNNRLAIGTFKRGSHWPSKTYFDLTYQSDAPLLDSNNIMAYYLNHLEDLNFMSEFMRRFQSGMYISASMTKYYYELKTAGSLSLESKSSLEEAMRNFITRFITKTDEKTHQKTIDYRSLRVLARMAANNEAKLAKTAEKVEEDISPSTPSLDNDEYLKLELKERYLQLRGNLTEEEKEAILKRIKDIEDYFRTSQKMMQESTSKEMTLKRKYPKKERPELYN